MIVLVAVATYFTPAALLFGGNPGTYATVAGFMVLPVASSYAITSAIVNRGRRATTGMWWGLGAVLYVLIFFRLFLSMGSGAGYELPVTWWLRVMQLAPMLAPLALVPVAALVSPRSQAARVAGRTLLLYALPLAVTRFLLTPIVHGVSALQLAMNVTTLYLVLRILAGLFWPLPVDREGQSTGPK